MAKVCSLAWSINAVPDGWGEHLVLAGAEKEGSHLSYCDVDLTNLRQMIRLLMLTQNKHNISNQIWTQLCLRSGFETDPQCYPTLCTTNSG